jgi:hypothetical protein
LESNAAPRLEHQTWSAASRHTIRAVLEQAGQEYRG